MIFPNKVMLDSFIKFKGENIILLYVRLIINSHDGN